MTQITAFVVIDISGPANMELMDSFTLDQGWGFTTYGRYAIVGNDAELKVVQLY